MQRIMQSIVQSPTHDNDPTFSLAIWVGTIGGSALPTDTAPNTSAPSAARVLQISPRKGAMLMHGSGVLRLCCGVVGSSSITIQSWFFDNTQALWIQFGAPVVITPTGAASNTSTQTISNVAGAKFFLQITANTLVQAFGYDFG